MIALLPISVNLDSASPLQKDLEQSDRILTPISFCSKSLAFDKSKTLVIYKLQRYDLQVYNVFSNLTLSEGNQQNNTYTQKTFLQNEFELSINKYICKIIIMSRSSDPLRISPNDPLRELFEACKSGDVIRVRSMVDSTNVNARDTAGRRSTPLHFAAGKLENLKKFLKKD